MTTDEHRGGEFYDDDRNRRAYLAHRHSGVHSPNTVMEEPALLDALGSLDRCRVLDLGCGDGSTAPLMLANGAASYVGIDGSARMIETARTEHGDGPVRFARQDIEDLDLASLDLVDGAIDVVISRMALHYIEHLGAVVARIHQALPAGGRFVFSVVHPVVSSHDAGGDGPRTSITVDRYFERGPRERSWLGAKVTWQHRTVADHVGLVTSHGFALTVLDECEPRPELLVDSPNELARRRRIPLILVIGATKILG